MEETDIGRRFPHYFPIQFQYEPQNTVAGRVRRPHVKDHFLAEIVALFLQRRLRRGNPRDRIRRFNFARRESHKTITSAYARHSP